MSTVPTHIEGDFLLLQWLLCYKAQICHKGQRHSYPAERTPPTCSTQPGFCDPPARGTDNLAEGFKPLSHLKRGQLSGLRVQRGQSGALV